MEILGIVVLVLSGIYFCFKLKFKHFNMFKAIKVITKNRSNGISSFESLCISLASKIGVGSLSGVVLSIYVGGVGSIFWMWVISLITSSNTMVESILAIKYRIKNKDNYYEGGPFYYMDLIKPRIGVIYAIIFLTAYIGGFIPIQANTISKVVTEIVHINPIFVGIIIVFLTSLVIFKGVKEIANTVSRLVPFITCVYVVTCLIVVFLNFNLLDDVILLIIKEAFNKRSFLTALTVGSLKSIFSTESGLGTGAIAASSSFNKNEEDEGLVQVFGINFDTFIVSTLTAFVVILSPYTSFDISNINGIEITRYAFIYHLGSIGGLVLTISIILYAFSTIIGGYYYIDVCIKYLMNKNYLIFKIIILIILLVATIISPSIIWDFIDKFVVLLAIINTIFMILLKNNVFIKKV